MNPIAIKNFFFFGKLFYQSYGVIQDYFYLKILFQAAIKEQNGGRERERETNRHIEREREK